MGSLISDIYLFLMLALVFGWIAYDFISYLKSSRKKPETPNTPEDIPETLVLKKTNYAAASSKGNKISIAIAILFAFFIMLSPLIIFVVQPVLDAPRHEQMELLTKLLSKISTGISNDLQALIFLILFVLALPFTFFISRYIQDEKIILDKSGISYHSPVPDILKSFFPNWNIKWLNIEELKLGTGLTRGQLIIHEKNSLTKRRLMPAMWASNSGASPSSNMFILGARNRNAMHNEETIMHSPLIRHIQKYTHLKLKTKENPNPVTDFDLSKQKEASIVAFLIIALLIYSLITFMTMSLMEIHTSTPPWAIYTPALLITVISFFYLLKPKIHRSIVITLSLLIGTVSGFACYPTSLFINRLSDSEGLHSYEYIKTSTNTFSPVISGLPEISIDRFEFGKNTYWNSVGIGETYEFQLRKGGLGFYQLAKEPIRIKSIRWHCLQRIEKNSGKTNECDDIKL